MNFFTIFGILLLFGISITVNSAYAEIDPLSDIIFFQTGEVKTEENKFQISSDISIREFSNGNIVRISGLTVEGFPYISYSQIKNNEIETMGKIFINSKFIKLLFNNEIVKEELNMSEKLDNLSILVKYSQRVYSNQNVEIQVKTFDPTINPKNDFTQNYGMIPNTDVQIEITDDEGIMIFSETGKADEAGFYESEFRVPVDKISTYTMTVHSSNTDSESSKIFQIIHAGANPSDK